MRLLRNILCVAALCVFASGCATKSLQVTVPAAAKSSASKGYVKIQKIEDHRDFQRAPSEPSIPSIEGDKIADKNLTDTSIGRMRHGLTHGALWNYSVKGDKDVYAVCDKIVTSSLTSAGYQVVSAGQEHYAEATPLQVDIIKFWAWMQPKFNIDLHFDGELNVKSLDTKKTDIDVNAKGTHMFSTGFAGGGAWTKVVNEGVKDLNKNLTLKFEGAAKAN